MEPSEEPAHKQQDIVPESRDDVSLDDEADELRGYRTQRRRLKQLCHRREWRDDRRRKRSEEGAPVSEDEHTVVVPTPVSGPPAGGGLSACPALRKRHRPSPRERTMLFFAKSYESDTRPADWALVYGERGGYEQFPYSRADPPLSQLSALVWRVEYDTGRLGSLSFRDVSSLQRLVAAKASELAFFRNHLRRVDGMQKEMLKAIRVCPGLCLS